jgi:hypothetical protein
MRILTANEQQAFDRPPMFDHCDRKKYFDLPKGWAIPVGGRMTP